MLCVIGNIDILHGYYTNGEVRHKEIRHHLNLILYTAYLYMCICWFYYTSLNISHFALQKKCRQKVQVLLSVVMDENVAHEAGGRQNAEVKKPNTEREASTNSSVSW